jgi:hypothetical protein
LISIWTWPLQKGLTSALTDQGPYEFAVSGAGENYINLFNTYLFVEAQIVNPNGRRLDFFCFAARFIDRSPGGPTPIMAFWSKLCPVDFNLDLAACFKFLPATTPSAIFKPIFKASRPKVLTQ